MFKKYNQQQNFIIPPSYYDFLGKKHEAKLLNNIINGLNLNFLYKSYKNNKLGTTAYEPSMLLKVLFYGYMNGIFSIKKIAKKLKSDLDFMFFAGNNQPDFRTINNFKKNKFLQISKNQKLVYKRNNIRLYYDEGKLLYKTRSNDIEAVFGNIKFNLGFERFLLRGLKGVQIEGNLINIVHNLKKIIKSQFS